MNIIYPVYDSGEKELDTPVKDVLQFHIDNWKSYPAKLRKEINEKH